MIRKLCQGESFRYHKKAGWKFSGCVDALSGTMRCQTQKNGWTAGSPTKAFIAQIVYWHELLLLDEKGSMPTYGVVISQLKQSDEKHLKRYIQNKKLTTSLVADLVGIPFETARRNLMVMCEEFVLEKSDVFGFLINKNSPFHAACVNDLNMMEKQNLCKLVYKITEGQGLNHRSPARPVLSVT